MFVFNFYVTGTTQLNSVIVCHVHQDILDNLDIHKIAADFAGRSDIRKSLFGNGPF